MNSPGWRQDLSFPGVTFSPSLFLGCAKPPPSARLGVKRGKRGHPMETAPAHPSPALQLPQPYPATHGPISHTLSPGRCLMPGAALLLGGMGPRGLALPSQTPPWGAPAAPHLRKPSAHAAPRYRCWRVRSKLPLINLLKYVFQGP